MTYIDLINNFWRKDIEHAFTEKEIAFYFYLLSVSNSIGWKSPFGLSSKHTMAKFGWGRTAVGVARKKLKQAGLIDFESGQGRGNILRYTINRTEVVETKLPKKDTTTKKQKLNTDGCQFKKIDQHNSESSKRKSEIIDRAARAVNECNSRN